jgi:transcription factor CRZ1
MSHAIPLHGPVSHPDGPRDFQYPHVHGLHPIQAPPGFILAPASGEPPASGPSSSSAPSKNERVSPKPDYLPSGIPESFHRTQGSNPPSPGPDSASASLGTPIGTGAGANHYPSSTGVPRLPPILQVEKQTVTTSATQLASASRRRNEAHFVCPVPGCGSTFTRRFNLRGTLWRSSICSSL